MKIKIQTLGDRNILEVVYSSDDLTKDDLSAQRELVSESLKKTPVEFGFGGYYSSAFTSRGGDNP